MSSDYRIFGSELSPYSVKTRSYFRYKGIPHRWLLRNPGNQEEFQKYARLPLVPLVITPEDQGIQDSTPILEGLEARYPEPPIHPADSKLRFLSALLEELGDEWGNKWMFHYRWWYPADQQSAADRISEQLKPDGDDEERRQVAAGVKERMIPRISFVGSSEVTKEQIEASFRNTVRILEAHLEDRPYLFGGRPVFADFGLWGQIYEASTDPTPGAMLRRDAPRVMAWVERMLEPAAEAEVEPWSALEPTLFPLLEEEVGGRFLPWSVANARALERGEASFTVELAGGRWEQQTQKYHARSLGALRDRYAAVEDRSELDPILERADCRRWLESPRL